MNVEFRSPDGDVLVIVDMPTVPERGEAVHLNNVEYAVRRRGWGISGQHAYAWVTLVRE